ncbi:DDE-type integrase/transposase/recombinase (plasmid) [Chromobacterium amazonense]|uniref:Mu transposase C-terminal domain-containing protein n=1 Tax=Chromobacterium amazonense TaxID=1382803 RepID=UPI00237E0BF2|nr:Mu transposase C-terminal domain-containing protein [Chromobacterium amazonense]MDE1712704.1 DDE-type integrase/transposase/recombinase [Chromobacterium amazonense]
MSLQLREGLSVQFQGYPYRVLDIQPGRSVTLMDKCNAYTKEMTFDEANHYFSLGKLKVVEDDGYIFREDNLPPIPSALPDHLRQSVRRRLQYVMGILAQTERTSCAKTLRPIAQSVAQVIGDQKIPSSLTLYRWCHAYLNSGEDIMSLVPRTQNCGRRHGQIHPDVLELFYSVLDRCYLTIHRNSKKHVHQKLIDEIYLENKKRPKEEWLSFLSYGGFCKLIKRVLDPFIEMARRYSERYALRYFRTRDRGPAAFFPLERVEIDHTILDVIIIHPITKKILGRPTVTVAIDRRTRMVCALYIDLAPPSSVAAMLCIKQAVTSKAELLQQYGLAAEYIWPVDGRIASIWMDNGPEFHSHVHKQLCSDLKMDLQYCPPGMPWYKAVVERFIGTLNTRLIHRLPGTTWSNPEMRANYPSEKLACITLEELRQLVFKWVVMDYHNTRHSELGETPLQCWKRLIEDHPIPVLSDSSKLETQFSLTFHHRISNGRISTKGLIYHHPHLIHLRECVPKNTKFMLRIDPEDVRQAYIYDPINKALMKLDCISLDTDEELSWREYLAMRKTPPADQGADDVALEKIRNDKAALNDEIFQLQARADQQMRKSKGKKPSNGRKKYDTKHAVIPVNVSATVVDDIEADDWEIEADTLRGDKNA